MNLLNNPELLDRLAAAHALGTLRGGARRRFETLARQSATVRAAALVWKERFALMTELQFNEAPSPNVWKRIENMLDAQAPAAVPVPGEPMLGKLRRALGLWRGMAAAGALATVAAVLVGVGISHDAETRAAQLAQMREQGTQMAQQNAQLAARLQAAPDIQYVSVLADDRQSASMLITYDPKHNTLTMKRVGNYQEGLDKSLQLWGLPPNGPPKSLGVLSTDAVVKLTAAEGEMKDMPVLAVTLEPKGGVTGGPTGPVVFKGPLIQTTL